MTAVIPTYNERENIGRVLDRCAEVLTASMYEYELLVVDDDSPDRTWELVEQAYADDKRVRVLRRAEDKGLALSVAAGFQAARMDACVVIDGDLQHPPEKIPELLAALDRGADLAIGSRYVGKGTIENWSWFRRQVSKGATAYARATIPTARRISDPMSGLFAVRCSVIEDVDLDPQGYKILLEILSKCEIDRIEEVAYAFRERDAGESKLTASQYQQFAEHALELSIGEYARLIGEQPQRAVRLFEFFAVGAVGVLVNTIVFYLAVTVDLHYLLAGGLAFIAAVQWNFVGNWAVTFDRPRDAVFRRYVAFHAVCLVGLLLYEVALGLLAFVPNIPILVANLGAIAISSVWNFVGSDTTAFAETFGDAGPVDSPAESTAQQEQRVVDE